MFKKAHRVSASGACDAVIFVWGAVITASVSDLIFVAGRCFNLPKTKERDSRGNTN